MSNDAINCFDNEVSCIFATDNYYAPYLSVAIESIIENSSPDNSYGIYILEENLSKTNKHKLKLLEKDNFKILFVNTKILVEKYKPFFFLHSYVTVATYYRFFIPELFKTFNRVIYLDCDLIVNCDIAELYKINLRDNITGCVRDIQIYSRNYQNLINSSDKEYYLNTLKLDNIDNYFNAGVMVLDLDKLRDFRCTEKCINFLQEIKYPKFSDQCIMNHVLRNNVLFMNVKWNFQNVITNPNSIQDNYKNVISKNFIQEIIEAQKIPNIIHYICKKPWNNFNIPNSKYFWKYAKKSPYYISIIVSFLFAIIKNINILQKIFSIKNLTTADKKYKVFTVLGLKIKFKINNNTFKNQAIVNESHLNG